MQNRSGIILFFASLLLFALLFWVDKKPPTSSIPTKAEEFVFPSLSVTNIQEITLTSGGYQVVLKRKAIGWHISYFSGGEKVVDDIASDTSVVQWITDIVHLKQASALEKVEQDQWNFYGLGTMGPNSQESVRVLYGNLTSMLHLGNIVENSSARLVYARLDEQDCVFLVDSRIKQYVRDIQKNPDGLRSRNPFHLDSNEIPGKIFWQSRTKEKLALFRTQEGWYLEYVPSDAQNFLNHSSSMDRASLLVSERLLQWMRNVRISQFVYGGITPKELVSDSILIGYKGATQSEYTILCPWKKAEIPDPISLRYAARVVLEGEEIKPLYPYAIASSWLEQIPQKIEDFLDPKIARFEPEQVQTVERKGKISWIISKDGKSWRLESPFSKELVYQEVQNFLKMLASLEAESFCVLDEKALADENSFVLSMTPSLVNRKSAEIGKSSENEKISPKNIKIIWGDKIQNKVSIRIEGEKTARVVDHEKHAALFDATYLDFYNRRVDAFVFAHVQSITIRRPPGQVYEIKKDGKEWLLQKPVVAKALAQNVEEILRNCAWIMAEKVVAEGDEEGRKKYGCFQSEYSLEITTEDPETKIRSISFLELGNREKHCMVWIRGFPYVYQIEEKLRDAIDAQLY